MDVASQHNFIDSLRKQKGTEEYSTTAEVTRIDGSDIYVRLPGSSGETCVENTSVGVSVGDKVDIVVSNYDTHITGNRTDIAPTSGGMKTIIKKEVSPLEAAISMQDAAIAMQNSTIMAVNSEIKSINSNLEAVNSQVSIHDSAFSIEDGVVTGLNSIIVSSIESEFIETAWFEADFSKVDIEKVRQLFATSGIIDDLRVKDGHFVGQLTAIDLDASAIKTGKLVTDCLYIKADSDSGDDGLYYALNLSALGEPYIAELPPEEQEKLKNGIHGDNIIAETIDARAINVDDLFAFNALIGGFEIRDNGIKSIDGAIELNSDGTWHFSGRGTVGEDKKFGGFYIAFEVDQKDEEGNVILGPDGNPVKKDGIYFMRENGDDDKVLASFEVINNESLLRTTNAEMLPPDYKQWTDTVESDHVDIGNIRFRNRATGNLSIFPRPKE